MQKKHIIIPVVALLVGIGIGASGGKSAPAAAPASAPTVTMSVPAPTVTVTATKEKVPQVCLDALNDSDGLVAISGEMATTVVGHLDNDSRLFTQFSKGDLLNVQWYLDEQKTFNTKVGSLTDRAKASTYATNRDACRATK